MWEWYLKLCQIRGLVALDLYRNDTGQILNLMIRCIMVVIYLWVFFFSFAKPSNLVIIIPSFNLQCICENSYYFSMANEINESIGKAYEVIMAL